MKLEAMLCTVSLALVALACVAHLKEMGRGARWCERVGFSVIFGGSVGSALEWWLPVAAAMRADTVFVVGCGLVAMSIVVRYVRGRLAVARGLWDGRERRARGADPFREAWPRGE